ncbi:hypothetical protein [Nonomuraea sp. NPDC049400]|uniref:hypothetical protein n=1 Tax=Nonomuraea sp. NPDC049400 TaxID=3364352 RepID=UPI0037907B0F
MGEKPQNVSSEPITSMGMRPGSTQDPQTTWVTGAGWLTTEAANKIKEWFESTDPVAVQRAGSYYLAAEGLLNRFAHDFKEKAIELAQHYKGPTAKATQEQLQYFHASVRELADKFGEVGRPLQDYAQTLARAQQDIKTSDDLGFFEGVPFKRMHDLENKAKDLLKKVNEEIVQHYDRLPRSIQQAMPDPNLNGGTPPFEKINMPSSFDGPNFDPNSMNSSGYDPNALNRPGLDPKNFDTDGMNDDGIDTRPIKTDGFNTGPTDPGRLNGNGLNGNGIDPNGLGQRGMGDNAFDTSGLNPNGMNPNDLDPNSLNPNGLNPNGLNPSDLNDRTGLANYVPNTALTDPNALNTPTGYNTSGNSAGSGYGSSVGNGTAATAANATRGTGMNGAPFFPMNAHPAGANQDGQGNRTSPLYEDDDVYTGGGPDTIVSNIDHRTV